ncbi:MAG: type II toxin-antitoxin system RelE/ParE family toxin [Nitrosomonas sp.]|nr:type II toxin-antitoxin system RelE/ParE family toxin [Nitrosomonas sp.]
MITGFANKDTEIFWATGNSKKIPSTIRRRAYRKLQLLHAATNIDFLRIPPSNHLEKLSGNRKDLYSIRINQQFRIVFAWKQSHATQVEIIDYH